MAKLDCQNLYVFVIGNVGRQLVIYPIVKCYIFAIFDVQINNNNNEHQTKRKSMLTNNATKP